MFPATRATQMNKQLPDMAMLVKIGVVTLPPAKINPRIKHPALAALGSDSRAYRTGWTRLRRARLRQAGLNTNGLPPKPRGRVARSGINWKLDRAAAMRKWRALRGDVKKPYGKRDL